MPPSLVPKNCSSILSSSQSSCRTGSIRVAQPLRSFSVSTKNQGNSLLRRKLYSWLHGPGAAFKEPAEGVNYLGAYDAKGNLKRAASATPGEPTAPSGSDFKPFPKNDNFISQPVTSEALREAVWERIMKNGLSVKEVSKELGIEMSRVGAIVRLKEVEKAWQRQVRLHISLLSTQFIQPWLPRTEDTL